MDDLLALMGSDHEDDSISLDLASEEQSSSQEKASTNSTGNIQPPAIKQSNHKSNAGSVDPFTKIRIVQRKTGKMELVDLFSPFQFVTTAVLASMNKTQLSALITHPSNNNDSDSPSGRSAMASMGIVLSNSGTRISKNGRAFSIITLGDLHTGPTVSIFLFGHAYSNFTTKIQTGSVIAVVGSSIMPSRQGGETRISLSVNDTQQLILVGKALDHGTCAGADTRKNYSNNGNDQSSNKVKCKKHVDLRLGRFCKFHQRQQQQNQGSAKKHVNASSAGKKTNMTFMQGLRAEKDMQKPAMARKSFRGNTNQPISSNTMTITMPGQGTVVTAHLGNPGMRNNSTASHQRGGLGGSKALEEALGRNNAHLGIGNRAPPPATMRQRASKHMSLPNSTTTRRTPLSAGQVGLAVSSSGMHNPYLSKAAAFPTKSTSSKPAQVTITNDILGQVLAPGRKLSSHTPLNKKSKSNPEKRTRNLVHMEGMNGQVQVPKPNALFNKAVTKNQYNSAPCAAHLQPITPSPKQRSAMLEKQKQLAERLRHGKTSAYENTGTKIKPKGTTKSSAESGTSDLDAILGIAPMSEETRASILEAKSKYSQEANAESYAKSRQAISELEKQEAKHDKRQARKTQSASGTVPASAGTAIIVSEYKCLTCKKITQKKPTRCIHLNHKVKRKREIKKKDSVTQQRMNLKTRSADDGGITLGAGLEWSEWGGR